MNGKNKSGHERRKKKSGLFFFWLGHELGPISKRGPWGPVGAGPGPRKKPGTLNGVGPGHGSCLRVGSEYGKTRLEPDPLPFLPETRAKKKKSKMHKCANVNAKTCIQTDT